ncbi:MAG TPA: hypothetical protein VGA00_04995 [Acidiferrobacterales bacterium]|jgi:hypothetical protein
MIMQIIEYWREIRARPWADVSGAAAGVFGMGLLTLFYVIKTNDDGFVPLLDHANLAFHEAGHLFFRVLGPTAALYGGTLGQLVFPVVALLTFWSRRAPIGAAAAGVWLFENFLNIARYMADARAQLLPLVGGGEHDWTNILGRWGALHADTSLAAAVRQIGWLGMLACAAWLAWRWSRSAR